MPDDVRVAAFLHAKPGAEEAVRQAALACVPPTRAEAGNRLYVLHQDNSDPLLLVYIEHWDSEAALKEHMRTAHFKTLGEALEGKLSSPLEVHVLKPF